MLCSWTRFFVMVHAPAFFASINTLFPCSLVHGIGDNDITWANVHKFTCDKAIVDTKTQKIMWRLSHWQRHHQRDTDTTSHTMHQSTWFLRIKQCHHYNHYLSATSTFMLPIHQFVISINVKFLCYTLYATFGNFITHNWKKT